MLLIVFMLLPNAANRKDMYKSFIWPEPKNRTKRWAAHRTKRTNGQKNIYTILELEHFWGGRCVHHIAQYLYSAWKFIDDAWTMDNGRS